MADAVVKTSFNPGATIDCYLARQVVTGQAAPVGGPVASATASASRQVTLTGLEDDTAYVLYGLVGAANRLVRFKTQRAVIGDRKLMGTGYTDQQVPVWDAGKQRFVPHTVSVVVGNTPINLVPPVVSGDSIYGATLSCTTGSWTNSPDTYAYQWLRGGVEITGATSSTYEVVGEDSTSAITCEVVATSLGDDSQPAVSSNSITIPAFIFASQSGSDSNAGTLAAPVKTLSKVQTLLTAGKTAVLKRGDTWKETLTVLANNVTIGAWGDDPVLDDDGYITNAPLLDGGAFFTGFASYAGGDEVRPFADDMTGSSGVDLVSHTATVGGGYARHDAFNSASTNAVVISGSGTRARRKAGTLVAQYYEALTLTVDDYYVEATIYVASTDTDFIEVQARGFSYTDKSYWARLGGSGSLTIGRRQAGTATNSSNGSFTVAGILGAGLVVGDTYRLRVEVQGSTIRGYIAHGAGSLTLFDTWTDVVIAAGDHAMLRFGSGSAVASDDTHGLHVDHWETGPLGTVGMPTNTYKSTGSTAQIFLLVMDDITRLKGPNVDQLADGQWYWQGNRLYVRRDAGAPGSTDIVVGSLDFGIDVGTHTDVTIDGVAFEHHEQRAITGNSTGAARLTVRRAMVQLGCNGEQGSNGCIAFYGNGCTVRDSVVRNVNNDGIYGVCSSAGAPQIYGNLLGPVTGFGADCCQVDAGESTLIAGHIHDNHFRMTSPDTPKGCLILFGGGYIVEDNFFEGTGNPATGSGAYGLSAAGDNFIVQRNIFYNHPNDAIRASSNSPTTARSGNVYQDNIFIDCGQAMRFGQPSSNMKVYSNTIVNVARTPQFQNLPEYVVHAYSTLSGEFKDNIIWNTSGGGSGLMAFDQAIPSFFRDYNVLKEATGFYKVTGTSYDTIAAVPSSETHSVNGDPLFVNLGGHAADGSDYIPQVGSSAILTGLLIPGYVHIADIGAKKVSPAPTTPPSNLALPVVTGIPAVGYQVTATNGTWESGDVPTFTYQWRSCDASGGTCADILGATSAGYEPQVGDVGKTLRVVVTAHNPFGQASATSAQSSVIAPNIDPSTNPDIVTDNFTDTAGTVLSSHTPDTGSGYVKHPAYTPTAVITAAGRARQNGGAGVSATTVYRNLTVPPTANYDVRATIYVASVVDVTYRTGICARLDASADTFYGARYSGANVAWELLLFTAGNAVVLDSYPVGIGAGIGYALIFVCRDAVKRVFIDGVERLTSADNSLTAAGFAGIRLGDDGGTDSTGLQVDGFRVIPA